MAGQLAIEYVAVASLKAAPYNPRVMPDEQMARLRQGIERFGLVDPVIVNQTTGNIVGGHQRVEAARQMGLTEVPVVYVTLNRAEEKALNIALNKVSGEFDLDKLKDLLGELREDGFDLELTGFSDEEIAALLDPGTGRSAPGSGDPDAAPEVDEKGPPTTKPGDLIILGRHRLLCGDSTDPAAIARLMDGAQADLVFTDPPYGIGYKRVTAGHRAIANDEDLGAAERVTINALKNAGAPEAVFVCCDWRSMPTMHAAMEAASFPPKACIVWDKERGVQNLDRFYKRHEFLLYAGPYGGQKTVDGDVWSCPRDFEPDHPTPKPVELIERAIGHASSQKANILDFFGGSGSTLIACERTGRSAYLMELDPRYCDVIVSRWEEYTGQKAQRPEQGAPSGRK